MAKIKTLRVPYKTTPQVFTDLIAGQIDFTFVDVAASKGLLDGGKIRALTATPTKNNEKELYSVLDAIGAAIPTFGSSRSRTGGLRIRLLGILPLERKTPHLREGDGASGVRVVRRSSSRAAG